MAEPRSWVAFFPLATTSGNRDSRVSPDVCKEGTDQDRLAAFGAWLKRVREGQTLSGQCGRDDG